jgi:hypothetical protein
MSKEIVINDFRIKRELEMDGGNYAEMGQMPFKNNVV